MTTRVMPADDVTSSLVPAASHVSAARRAAMIMGGLAAAVLLSLILWGHDDHRASYDQNVYHLPTIRQFASELPRPNFSDYLSATTPGYHLIVAVISKVGGFTNELTALKLVAALFSVGLLGTIAHSIGRRVGAGEAVALTLPLLCSLYVISSGAWLLPDNAAWWGVAGVMILALGTWRGTPTFWLGGAVLLATVLTRQSNLWCAAPLCAAAAFATDDADNARARRVAGMILATIPAFAATLYFIWIWHGTAPPAVRNLLRGGNPAAPAAVMSLIGAMTPFFGGYLIPALLRSPKLAHRALLIGAVLGFVVGVAPATSYDMEAGRWSGLWNAVKHFPVVANRSTLIILLSCAGGAALGAWAVALPRRAAWVFLIAWIAFIAAQAANGMAFQRYYEPMVLISLPLAVAHLPDNVRERRPAIAWYGPALLTLLLAAVTVATLTKRNSASDDQSDNREVLVELAAPRVM